MCHILIGDVTTTMLWSGGDITAGIIHMGRDQYKLLDTLVLI